MRNYVAWDCSHFHHRSSPTEAGAAKTPTTMSDEIRQTLSAILRRSDEVLGTTPETDLNYMFLHTIANYASAKQESRGALTRIGEAISIETRRPSQLIEEGQIRARFVNLLQRRFSVNSQEANELFEVLRKDAE